ncbi:MAG TPA: glutamine-hydrolyzing GMP synthase [Candidatus Peribacterales bacterium]|nr:glutamine-hydrolyzing GMP synthase [Candidatus Peribacterales bacterium]
MPLLHPRSIVILDFGGQYAHLIGNRVRKLGAFSEIHDPEISATELKGAAGIILSGGPQSVYDPNSPKTDPKIFDLGIPVLGICYGHQWMAQALGGEVHEGKMKEYGYSEIQIVEKGGALFDGLKTDFTVWMSHGDEVTRLPAGFVKTATSEICTIAAMADEKRKFFGVQFHPEVAHTENGLEILRRFLDYCNAAHWELSNVLDHLEKEIEAETKGRNVFILVSGGVDSTVAFALLNKTLGVDRVYGLLIDHGLMRKGEMHEIADSFAELGFTNLHIEDASAQFLEKLKGITDPEQKRQLIGDTFLAVQAEVAKRLNLDGPQWMLGQGTIYPDTIETGGTKHADHIKTHHNRVAAIEKMIAEKRVIEPLKELYKDEVRVVGESLGLPHHLVHRHPFPGPGLGVRILCAQKPSPLTKKEEDEIAVDSKIYVFRSLPILSVGVQGDSRSYKHPLAVFLQKPFSDLRSIHGLATAIPNTHKQINRVLVCVSHQKVPEFIFTPTTITRDLAETLREADHIVSREMREEGLEDKIWQFPVILIPIGVKKEGRLAGCSSTSEGRSIVLRPVESQEAMTANAFHLTEKFLVRVTKKILEIEGIDMVFYDVTNKPPATIEWE